MYTPITLDKVRNFNFDYEHLSMAEEALDMSIDDIINKAAKGKLRLKELFTLAHAGLVHEDGQLTVKSVMAIVNEHSDIETLSATMGEAIGKSLRKAKTDEKN